jgi:Coenzyme PQQ synthesis protein D (PqqD)
MQPDGGRPPRRNPSAGFRIFEGQAVVVLPDEAEVNVLNEVGARVWELIDGERSVQSIVDQICEEYDMGREQVERDVRELLGNLNEHRMIE